MTQEELMGLIGLVGGLGGSYFLGGKKEDRELERKIKEAKAIAEAEAEIREKEYAKAETRAENKQFRKEGRYTEGDKRGELKNPNSLYNFIFNPSESDPFHEMLGGGVIADSILGTTAYDDPAIRNQEREDFVANPENNFLTDTGALGLGSLFIPGFGLLRGANALSKLGPSMMANLSKMFGGTRGATSVTPITDPSRLLPMYNDGGRVNYNMGTGPQGVSSMMAPLRQNVEVNDDALTEALFSEMMGAQMSDNDEGIPLSLLESMAEEQEMAKRDRLRELMQYFRD